MKRRVNIGQKFESKFEFEKALIEALIEVFQAYTTRHYLFA